MSQKLLFTVFTPIFNRKHTIHRVWESLKAQTYRNFEWIIIDDGSTDGVWDLLEYYKSNSNFQTVIASQKNKGKHVAWNYAVNCAEGELFIPADSDDSFSCNALERFAFYWNSIPENKRNEFSGINVLCKDSISGEIVGDLFPESPLVSNNLELFYKYRIQGEKWGCLRVDLLRQRQFPEESRGRGVFPLSYLFYWLARHYQVLCINEALRNYFQDSDNCITKNNLKSRHIAAPNSYLALSWHLNNNYDYIFRYMNFMYIVKIFLSCWRTGLLANKNIKNILKDFDKILPKTCMILTIIPGIIIYILTFKKYKDQ